jgi:hypothetical protein
MLNRYKIKLTKALASEARRRPLGAYFRVSHRDRIAMHAAIAAAGIPYTTRMVHEGWENVKSSGIILVGD